MIAWGRVGGQNFRNQPPGNRIAGPPPRLALPAPPNGVAGRGQGNNRVMGSQVNSRVMGGQVQTKAPFRRLTDSERDELRRKGLCFRCKTPYTPTHECPMRHLRILLVTDDEAPLLELEEIALDEEPNLQLEATGLRGDSSGSGPLKVYVRRKKLVGNQRG
ncbi:hypothetical protein BUALT_Bualt01G0051400 [Buddleja alternifolia]|uniref:Uncharacterized protein n=1 Tax=Buddleja alternifolia TaxID=168488 RepID=A0AAV6Y5N6_9LAMI|nr:hypothetical protein BUALT_Bualt01G0051400 [Buddleja alternifolia]